MFLKKKIEDIDCSFCGGFKATLAYKQESNDVFGEKLMNDFREQVYWNHWYAIHYNCAYCGKWIQSQERDLVIAQGQPFEVHADYNNDGRLELLRMHASCIEKVSS